MDLRHGLNVGRGKIAVLCFASVTLMLAGCASGQASAKSAPSTSSPSPSQITVAAVEPLSGLFAQNGSNEVAGMKAAISDINAAGGIKALHGAKLKLVTEDAGSTAQSATTAMQAALAQHPVAVFGAWLSTLTEAIQPLAERAQVPLITEGFDDAVTSQGYRYTFDYAPPNSQIASKLLLPDVITSLKADNITLHKVAVVGDNTAAASPLQKDLKSLLRSDNVQVVYSTQWQPPLSDPAPIAQAIAAAHPDAVFMIAYSFNDVHSLYAQLRSLNVNVPVIQDGGQAMIPAWQNLGSKLTGLATFVITSTLNTPVSRHASQEIAAQTKQPFVGQDQLDGYFEAELVAAALQQGHDATGTGVQKALASINVTSGPATGIMPEPQIAFSANGRIADPSGVLVQWQPVQGTWQPCVIEPTAVAPCQPRWTAGG